jgi:hypothetical protein
VRGLHWTAAATWASESAGRDWYAQVAAAAAAAGAAQYATAGYRGTDVSTTTTTTAAAACEMDRWLSGAELAGLQRVLAAEAKPCRHVRYCLWTVTRLTRA